jgi:hypothetical protein
MVEVVVCSARLGGGREAAFGEVSGVGGRAEGGRETTSVTLWRTSSSVGCGVWAFGSEGNGMLLGAGFERVLWLGVFVRGRGGDEVGTADFDSGTCTVVEVGGGAGSGSLLAFEVSRSICEASAEIVVLSEA